VPALSAADPGSRRDRPASARAHHPAACHQPVAWPRQGTETRLWAIGGIFVAIVLTATVAFVIYHRSNPTALSEGVGSARATAPDGGSSERPAPLRPSPAVRAVAPTVATELPGPIGTPEPFLSDRPRVEVVFCLDTTASMGHLLQGAKQKIWAVSNQVLTGRPTPDLRIGLVAYRTAGPPRSISPGLRPERGPRRGRRPPEGTDGWWRRRPARERQPGAR
jgi:hypothetical protein